MMNEQSDFDQLDELIKESLQIQETPSFELNRTLKTKLREKEILALEAKQQKHYSLWYVPMLLNSVIFILLAVLVQLMIPNIVISTLLTFICFYFIVAGISLTLVGLKFSNLKECLMLKF